MDRPRFDDLVMDLAAEPRSRRTALRLVAGAALTGLLARANFGGRVAAAAGC